MDIPKLRKNEEELEGKISVLLRQRADLQDEMSLTRSHIETANEEFKDVSIKQVIGEATEIEMAKAKSKLEKIISGDSENHRKSNVINDGLKLLKERHRRAKIELRSAVTTKLKESATESIEAISEELYEIAQRYLIAVEITEGVPLISIDVGGALRRAVLGSENQNTSKFMAATRAKREELLLGVQ